MNRRAFLTGSVASLATVAAAPSLPVTMLVARPGAMSMAEYYERILAPMVNNLNERVARSMLEQPDVLGVRIRLPSYYDAPVVEPISNEEFYRAAEPATQET